MGALAGPSITESELQTGVIDLARALGYRVAHFRAARTARGWRTPVQADGKGFPDLVLARSSRVVFAELKGDRGRLTADQAGWLGVLETAAETHVWTPADWFDGSIEKALR